MAASPASTAAPLRLAPGEEGGIVDQAVLGDLGIARQQLAPGQGVEHVGVGQHQARLIEGADQVLAVRVLMPVLPPTERIDLGQQGGRHLDEVDAAQQRRGGKAGEVADHAAAQRHQRGLAVGPLVEQRVHQPAEGRELLAALACRHGDERCRDAGLVERGGEARAIERRHGLVGHDDDSRRGQQRPR